MLPNSNIGYVFFTLMRPYIKWFKLSDNVHVYLTNIMTRMVEYHPNTLVELFAKAQTEDQQLQVEYWTELADRCLFVAGCFPESLPQQGLSFDWVFKMAENGYKASANMGNDIVRDIHRDIYIEIAHNIIESAWVMRETYIEVQLLEIHDINVIYDFFIRSQSMAAQRKLQELGFHFANGDDTEE